MLNKYVTQHKAPISQHYSDLKVLITLKMYSTYQADIFLIVLDKATLKRDH